MHMTTTKSREPLLSPDDMLDAFEQSRQNVIRQFVEQDCLAEMLKDYSNGYEDSHEHSPLSMRELLYEL